MARAARILAFVLLTIGAAQALAQSVSCAGVRPPPAYAAAADSARQLTRTLRDAFSFPGLSIAVGGRIVWSEAFGFANVRAFPMPEAECLARGPQTRGVMSMHSIGVSVPVGEPLQEREEGNGKGEGSGAEAEADAGVGDRGSNEGYRYGTAPAPHRALCA